MKRFLVIVLALLMFFAVAGCSNSDEIEDVQNIEEDLVIEKQIADESIVELTKVDEFIEAYNKLAPTPITDAVEINIKDEESGYYRSEFRLTAFDDAIAKTGTIGDTTVDIVCYGWGYEDIRIYAWVEQEQAKEIIKYASPILDSSLMEADIQEVLDYIDENNSANGYYYGKIGLVFLGNEFMLKVE